MIGKWFKKAKKPGSKNRARNERAPKPKLNVDWLRWLPMAAGVVAAGVAVIAVGVTLDRPIRHVDAVGAFKRVTVLDVERVTREKLHGGFVRANLAEVQGALEAMPWVDNARVQRRWPDSLTIQITEQEAIARWGDSGLVNSRGELFVRNEAHIPEDLPLLVGPEGTERRVADLFFQVRTQLESAELSIGGLRLDERGAWEVSLANGVVIRLGRREVQERIDRFLKSGATLVTSRAADIAYIDMRYSNGFAVGWRASQSRTG